MPANRLQIKKALQYPYDRILFAKEVLSPVFGSGLNLFKDLIPSEGNLTLSESKVIDKVHIYGSIKLEDDTEIACYEINLQPSVRIERSKVIIQKYVRKLLTSGQAALVNFITPNDNSLWRLTLVAKDSILTDDGVEERLTHAKRYTYLVGPAENCTTVAERLEALSIEKQVNFDSLVNAFSVEKLNKAFYKDISEQFYKLIGATIGKGKTTKTYDKALQLPSVSSEASKPYQEFAVRLIGRTVFCWFLKVKKSDAGISLLPEHLLSSKAVTQNPNYYHKILEKLFFQTLNTPTSERIADLPNGCEYIPFLNGGLFEAQYDDYYKLNAATGYSSFINNLIIPDQWFVDFFEKLEQYNFTIDENSVLDVEVSVDPEMLGSIFENLLAEIDPDSGETARKATGSFYTPREIVDYMATESLLYYLSNKTSLAREVLEPIFSIAGEIDFVEEERERILTALDELKILDPACGSGAFPMGVLQKMVFGLQKLDNNAEWWIRKQIDKTNDVNLREKVGKKLSNNPDYARKIGIIQNSLYGVDIQPIAAEISKLRCFLTLIVDEHIDESRPNRGIEPLPNLEFKFVTADTLLKLPDETSQVPMYNSKKKKNPLELLNEIQLVRFDYLQSVGDEKQILKERFHEIQKEIFDQQGLFGSVENNRAFKIANWKPFSHEKTDWFDPEWMFGVKGFDIVIGNPPYGTVYDKTVKPKYEKLYISFKRNNDIYVAFFENAYKLLINRGVLIFITPNTFLNGDYFLALRSYITRNFRIKEIIDFKNSKIFSDPTVYVAITSITKVEKEPHLYTFDYKLSDSKFKNIASSEIKVLSASSQPLKPIKLGAKIIAADNSALLDNHFFVKDVGFNYWSIGKGKKRDGDSIGDRILYSGIQLSKTDKSYIKGRDIEKFKIKPPSNYLRSNYQSYLKNGVDVFRYSEEILNQIPKIVYRQTSSSIIAALDQHANLCDKTVHVIIPRHNTVQFELKYMVCLLNSKLMDFLYKDISQESGGRAFAQVKTTYIKKLPLKEVSIEDQAVFCNLFDYIDLLNRHAAINDQFDVETSIKIREEFEKLIDALVNEIYFNADFKAAKIELLSEIRKQVNTIDDKSTLHAVEIINKAYAYLRENNNDINRSLSLIKFD